MLRALAAVLCGLFLLSAGVQVNDPDPALWVALYGLAAVLAALCAAGRLPFWPNLAALVLFLTLFLAWSPTLFGARSEAFTSFEMRAAGDEEPREAIGLLLCAGWSTVQTFAAWRRSTLKRQR
jgi:hypothetical protein